MRIDLVALVKRAGKYRASTFTAAEIQPTGAMRDDLLRIYMRVVREWLRQWQTEIRPQYEATLAEGLRDSVNDVQGTTDAASNALNRLVVSLDAELSDWVVRTEEWHRGQFGKLFTPVGVRLDMLLGAGDVGRTLQAVLADNVSLIQSLNDQMRNGISGAVFRGLTNRTPARDVAREIRKQTGIGKRRAELIAADQLQKLTGRLDQQRQEQLGLTSFEWAHSGKLHPREWHKERNGKVFRWDSEVGKTDPPGFAIRCGCRARAVVDLEAETGADTGGQPPVPPPPPVVEPVAIAPPAPRPAPGAIINPNVTAETIRVEKRLALQKRLRGEFETSARDSRYEARREFRDRQDKDFGNATFAAAFDDEAVSMVAALKPELDALADRLGVPRLRGFKSISGTSAVANQGDGVMGLNPTYFNGYAERVGGRAAGDAVAEIQAKRDALQAEMAPLVERVKTLREQAATGQYGSSEWQAVDAEERALFGRLRKLRDDDSKLWRKQNAAKGHAGKPVSTWKPGDGAKGRPFTIDAYFDDGVDRARTTLFHEFGHHVHQYLKREGPRRQFGTPPLERDLVRWYRRDLHADPNRILSTYGTKNAHEWFAESFSAYVMGRKDLLGPSAIELIEAIFNGTY